MGCCVCIMSHNNVATVRSLSPVCMRYNRSHTNFRGDMKFKAHYKGHLTEKAIKACAFFWCFVSNFLISLVSGVFYAKHGVIKCNQWRIKAHLHSAGSFGSLAFDSS